MYVEGCARWSRMAVHALPANMHNTLRGVKEGGLHVLSLRISLAMMWLIDSGATAAAYEDHVRLWVQPNCSCANILVAPYR